MLQAAANDRVPVPVIIKFVLLATNEPPPADVKLPLTLNVLPLYVGPVAIDALPVQVKASARVIVIEAAPAEKLRGQVPPFDVKVPLKAGPPVVDAILRVPVVPDILLEISD
jgi:hypothetical protein